MSRRRPYATHPALLRRTGKAFNPRCQIGESKLAKGSVCRSCRIAVFDGADDRAVGSRVEMRKLVCLSLVSLVAAGPLAAQPVPVTVGQSFLTGSASVRPSGAGFCFEPDWLVAKGLKGRQLRRPSSHIPGSVRCSPRPTTPPATPPPVAVPEFRNEQIMYGSVRQHIAVLTALALATYSVRPH
jgi:hypothetical protein